LWFAGIAMTSLPHVKTQVGYSRPDITDSASGEIHSAWAHTQILVTNADILSEDPNKFLHEIRQ